MLKPCPFCGSKATLTSHHGGSGNYGSYTLAAIGCTNKDCKIEMHGEDITWQGHDSAMPAYRRLAVKWNDRI